MKTLLGKDNIFHMLFKCFSHNCLLGTGHYLLGGGAGANGGTIFYAWLKGGVIQKYANVLPGKMLKAASGCHKKYSLLK